MLEIWLLVVGLCAVTMLVSKFIFPHHLDIAEIGLTLVGSMVVSAALIFGGQFANQSDTQILNGQVVNKTRDKVSCSHSYSCHCHQSCTYNKGHRSCTTHCKTCYEHRYDVDWNVHTTVGTFDIDRVDRRGLDEPHRWSIVKIGEPAATTRMYTNYVKAAPESLFNKVLLESGKYHVPAYPYVSDYYRINRIVQVGTNIPNVRDLNERLNAALRTLGAAKQVNIVPVFTTYDYNFSRVLEAKWLGGKKNDVVVVVGLKPSSTEISWVYVFSWSKTSLVNVVIRDGLMELDNLDNIKYTDVVTSAINQHYQRRPMSEFEYLRNEYSPPAWLSVLAAMLCLFGSMGAAYYFSRPQNRLL